MIRRNRVELKVIDNNGQAIVFGKYIEIYHPQLDLLVSNLDTMEWYSYNAIRFNKSNVCEVLGQIASFLKAYDDLNLAFIF